MFHPWVGMTPWKREWQPTPVFLPGEFHGQRSLAGTVQGGCKESDMAEQLTHTVIQRTSGKGTFWIQVCQFQGLWFSHWIQRRRWGKWSGQKGTHTLMPVCACPGTDSERHKGRQASGPNLVDWRRTHSVVMKQIWEELLIWLSLVLTVVSCLCQTAPNIHEDSLGKAKRSMFHRKGWTRRRGKWVMEHS